MSKRINEEVLVPVIKKIKKVPFNPKNLWEIGLTKGKLIEAMKGFPDDTPIITIGLDHTYESISVKTSTALFDNKQEIINEDFGEDLTPQEKYGIRKEVIVII